MVIKKEFIFNDVSSLSYELQMVVINGTSDSDESTWSELEISTNMTARGDIVETGVKYNPSPRFEMTLVKNDGDTITDDEFESIAIWLQPDINSHWLEIVDDSKFYLAKAVAITRKIIGGYLKGIGITWQSNSRWAMSEEIKCQFHAIKDEQMFSFDNKSSSPFLFPLLKISPISKSITIQNLSTNDGEINLFDIDSLELNTEEVIILDNENQMIYIEPVYDEVTKLLNQFFNWNWFRLKRGTNEIKVKGQCEIEFTYRIQKIGGMS